MVDLTIEETLRYQKLLAEFSKGNVDVQSGRVGKLRVAGCFFVVMLVD